MYGDGADAVYTIEEKYNVRNLNALLPSARACRQ